MRVAVSINTNQEDGEKNVSYQSISYSINGFGASVSIRELKEVIDTWLRKQPTRIEDELKASEKENA